MDQKTSSDFNMLLVYYLDSSYLCITPSPPKKKKQQHIVMRCLHKPYTENA